MRERLQTLGWSEIEIIDDDLGGAVRLVPAEAVWQVAGHDDDA